MFSTRWAAAGYAVPSKRFEASAVSPRVSSRYYAEVLSAYHAFAGE